MTPAVSIVIPNKNRAQLVVETLDSLRAQTLPNWEAHVVDDGSTDGSVAVVESVSRQDSRIHSHCRQGQPGGNTCRNEGWQHSRGDWVMFLDSDDLLSPVCLEGRLRAMEGRDHLDFGVFPHDLFQKRPGDLHHPFHIPPSDDYVSNFLGHDIPWQTCGPSWRRRSMDRLEPWDPGLKKCQDSDFHVRALLTDLRFQIFSEPRFLCRVGDVGNSVCRVPNGPETFEPRERMMVRTWELIEKTGQWTPRRRIMMARLHFILADLWAWYGDLDRARRIWDAALERRVVSRPFHFEGRLFLAVHRLSLARKAVRLFHRFVRPHQTSHESPVQLLRLQD